MTLVPDASVAVKWLVAETGSEAATALLNTDRPLAAPSLLRVEVAAAILRLHRMNQVSLDDAKERLAAASHLLSFPRMTFSQDSSLLRRAEEIALIIRHNLQHCIYIACAERYDAELVSADAELVKRASSHFNFVKLL